MADSVLLPGQWEGMAWQFIAGYPEEVVVVAYTDGTSKRLENTHENPREHFSISEADKFDLMDAHDEGLVLALIHSHPDKPDGRPSDHDYQVQTATGMTWGIVSLDGDGEGTVYSIRAPEFWGDAVLRGPLEGREYLWGIRDCFCLVRDFYRADRGILLPDAPRFESPALYPTDHRAHSVFADWIKASQFERIPVEDRQRGDAFTFNVRSRVTNHCGIYMGGGKYLDAMTGRVSAIRTLKPNEETALRNYGAQFYRLKANDDQG